jgi:hypothetical protein
MTQPHLALTMPTDIDPVLEDQATARAELLKVAHYSKTLKRFVLKKTQTEAKRKMVRLNNTGHKSDPQAIYVE